MNKEDQKNTKTHHYKLLKSWLKYQRRHTKGYDPKMNIRVEETKPPKFFRIIIHSFSNIPYKALPKESTEFIAPHILVTASLFNLENNSPIGRTFESQPIPIIESSGKGSYEWDSIHESSDNIILYLHTKIKPSQHIVIAIGLSIVEMSGEQEVISQYNVGYTFFQLWAKHESQEQISLYEGSVMYLLSKNQQFSNNISTMMNCTVNFPFQGLKNIRHLFPDSYLVGNSDVLPGVNGGKLPLEADIVAYKVDECEQVYIEEIQVQIDGDLEKELFKEARKIRQEQYGGKIPCSKFIYFPQTKIQQIKMLQNVIYMKEG